MWIWKNVLILIWYRKWLRSLEISLNKWFRRNNLFVSQNHVYIRKPNEKLKNQMVARFFIVTEKSNTLEWNADGFANLFSNILFGFWKMLSLILMVAAFLTSDLQMISQRSTLCFFTVCWRKIYLICCSTFNSSIDFIQFLLPDALSIGCCTNWCIEYI